MTRRRRPISPKKKARLKARGVLRTSLDPNSARFDSFLQLTDKVARILSDAGLLVEEQPSAKKATPDVAETDTDARYVYAVLEYVGRWRQRSVYLFDTEEEANEFIKSLNSDVPMCVSPCRVPELDATSDMSRDS